jgi:hypothetical protein
MYHYSQGYATNPTDKEVSHGNLEMHMRIYEGRALQTAEM